MSADPDIVVESDWLPAAEIRRAVDECRADIPEVSVSVVFAAPDERGLDPTIVAALISGISTVTVPFLTVLAARIFAKEDEARIELVLPEGAEDVVLTADVAADDRERIVGEAVQSGARRVRIRLAGS